METSSDVHRFAKGGGRGAGEREEKKSDTEFFDSQVKQNVGKGASVVTGLAGGPNRKGQAQEEIKGSSPAPNNNPKTCFPDSTCRTTIATTPKSTLTRCAKVSGELLATQYICQCRPMGLLRVVQAAVAAISV